MAATGLLLYWLDLGWLSDGSNHAWDDWRAIGSIRDAIVAKLSGDFVFWVQLHDEISQMRRKQKRWDSGLSHKARPDGRHGSSYSNSVTKKDVAPSSMI